MSSTAQFVVLSAVALTALGVVLASVLSGIVEKRTLSDARRSASVAAVLGVQPHLSAEDLDEGLSPERREALDIALEASTGADSIKRLKIFNRHYSIVYSDNKDIIGDRFPAETHVAEALRGTVSSKFAGAGEVGHEGERRFGELMEVFVPLRYDGAIAGVAEVYLPFEPFARDLADDRRHLTMWLIAGLLVFYCILLPIMLASANKLRRKSAENEYLALHDPLTGLPNRTLLFDRIGSAVSGARRRPELVAVALIDLNRFKDVNDTLGHSQGDVLLQGVAGRLRGALRAEDTIGRLGGDEFAVVLPRLASSESAFAAVERMLEALGETFLLESMPVALGASVGVALYPDHGDTPELLLRQADVAMYHAKGDRVPVALYDTDRDEHSMERLVLLAELREALVDGQLLVHYQPKAELRSTRIVGVEALVRWRHPRRGEIGPDVFVPLAEHTGMIGGLTDFVLRTALHACRDWTAAGHRLHVAVNLSPSLLRNPQLPGMIRQHLLDARVDASQLVLEITESGVMEDRELALSVLEQLDDLGVVMSIDDFGTGYSSLGHLQRLPVRELKIDRRFVETMTTTHGDAVIVRSIIDLARNLGFRIVAEGVEDADTWDQLTQLGCHHAQGYFLSRPMNADLLPQWLSRRTKAATRLL